VPFHDETGFVVERTDGAGPPRRGWLGATKPKDAPAETLAGVVWLLSRHGRYGRAVMLHQHLRELRRAGRWPRWRPDRGLVLHAVRRIDRAALRRWTLLVAIRWAALTDRLSRGRARVSGPDGRPGPRPRSHSRPGVAGAVGALAVPLVLPAVLLAAAAVAVVLVVDVSLWALFTAGGSIRRTGVAPRSEEVAPPSFDWTPS
jgi:hypothetical protein